MQSRNVEFTEEERAAFAIAGRAGARKRWAGKTPEERSEHARRMAEARWGSKGEQGSPDRDK